MAKLSIKPDSTSVSLDIFILDSTSTVGAGKTGLAYNTASLTCYYSRPTAAPAAISLVTQTVTGAWSSGGFVEIDATNMPGVYRFDVPNAVLAAGVRSAVVMLKGATGMAPLVLEVDLGAQVDVALLSGDAGAADNAEAFFDGTGYAGTNNVIPTVTTLTAPVTAGTVSDKTGYALTSAYDAAKTAATQTSVDDLPTNSELATALGTVDDATLAAIAALNNLSSAQAQSAATAALNAYDPPTNAEMEARTLLAANYFDPAADVVAHVTLVDTVTTLTNMPAAAPTAAANADAVWDELLAGHAGAGSAGLALATASSGGVDPSVLADAIWDEALSGHSTGGTAGKKLTDLVNADLSGVATSVALDDIPTVAEFEARTLPSTDYVIVSDLPSVPSAADNKAAMEADGGKLDHIWEMTADDAGVRQLTAHALELAPTGGGGTGLTAQETADAVNNLAPAGASGAAGSIRAQLVDAAKTGADGDTLETLSDQIDGVQAGSGLTAQETVNAVHNLAPVGVAAAGSIGANLDSILNGLTGVGLIPLVYTVTEPGGVVPISGVTVELYTEEACLNCVRRGVTNSFGVITFWMSTVGTYWIKCAKDGYGFDLDSETVAV